MTFAQEITALREMFTAIRDERRTHANTASRVGSAFLAILDYLDNAPFIRKDREDSDAFLLHLLKGAVIGEKDNIKLNPDGSIDCGSINASGDATLGNVSLESVRSKGFTESDRTLIGGNGFELYKDKSGKSHLYVDNAVIRGKLLAAETEVRKISYSGGTMVLSNAGSTIVRVVGLDAEGREVIASADAKAFKCWASADDGTTRTMNWWKSGDMAMCKTFNVKGGNRYYWRLVIARGQEKLEDGKLYDYVVLSNLKSFVGGDAVYYPRKS